MPVDIMPLLVPGEFPAIHLAISRSTQRLFTYST